MTDNNGLEHISLGFSAAAGRLSVDQCIAFKEKLRDAIGQRDPAGAWLETVVDGPRRGIQVTYDVESEDAADWAKRAEKLAPSVWCKVKKQKERVRA